MKKENFIITISGTPGSGKSTIAKNLVKIFNAKRVYVGGIRRDMAKEKGMTLMELNQYALTNPEADVDVDKKVNAEIKKLAKKFPVIVEGRTQFHFFPDSIKLYIKADLEEGAKRIWLSLQKPANKAKRNEARVNSLKELMEKIINREKNDLKRYKKYYNLNHTDKSHYDFIIDTTHINAKQATQKVVNFIQNCLK